MPALRAPFPRLVATRTVRLRVPLLGRPVGDTLQT